MMLFLPLEIVHIICSLLDSEDVYAFRLVCKSFREIGAKSIFREVSFFLHADDLQQLENVAKRYPTCVLSLVYHGMTLEDEISFADFALTHERVGDPQYLRKRRVAPTSNLQREYIKYAEALQSQRSIIDDNFDIHCLIEVLRKFPRLQSITISSDGEFRQMQTTEDGHGPFNELMSYFHQKEPNPRGVRHLEAILNALQTTVAELDTLRVGRISWKSIEFSFDLLHVSLPSLHRLRHLELVFDTEDLWDSHNRRFEADICRHKLHSGVLRQFLGRLPLLEVLNIDFTYKHHGRQFAASIDDVLPRDLTWRNLRSLALRGLEDGHQDFKAVLERHKDTLKEICLNEVKLCNTSLPELLRFIRENLKLGFACFCGDILDVDGHGQIRMWTIWRPDEDERWHHIQNYCCREDGSPKEGVCPLAVEWDFSWSDDDDQIDYKDIESYKPAFNIWNSALF